MPDPCTDELDEAFHKIEGIAPERLRRAIRWMRRPQARLLRLPLGALFIIGSFFWFLPVLGLWFLPVGLLLIAQDVPPLRRPVGKMALYLHARWIHLRKWWSRRRLARRT